MNRRNEPRFDVYYRAKIFPVDHPETHIDALLTDISGGGMRLVATEALAADQVVCVEVGQHLVLAEVRSAVPRGSRFLIGAEKVHTLNLLTLPDSMGTLDRIHALVDDYHLRIQFALESDRKAGEDVPAARAKPDLDSLGAKLQAIVPATPPAETQSEAKPPAKPAARRDPGLAPPMRTDPVPAILRPAPVNSPVHVDFGQLRIVLPETHGLGEEIAPEAGQAPVAVQDASDASVDLPPPVQPIWMMPPSGAPFNGETARETDPLRAMAIQQHLAAAAEPEPRNHSRTIAVLVAGLVAAVVLISLLFGPIRNRAMLLLPFASASDKSAKKAAAPESTAPESTDEAKSLVIQVEPEAAKPDQVETKQPAAPEPPASPASASSQAHSSSIRTLAPSWIWACVDGKPLAGKMLAGGTTFEIEFSRQAEVLVGNAGGVQMALDGKPLGPLGPDGRARMVELTPTGFHVAPGRSQECGNP